LCHDFFLLEEQLIDVVIEIIGRERSLKLTKRQVSDLIWDEAIWIPIDDRNLIGNSMCVGLVVSVPRISIISRIDNAGVLHL